MLYISTGVEFNVVIGRHEAALNWRNKMNNVKITTRKNGLRVTETCIEPRNPTEYAYPVKVRIFISECPVTGEKTVNVVEHEYDEELTKLLSEPSYNSTGRSQSYACKDGWTKKEWVETYTSRIAGYL